MQSPVNLVPHQSLSNPSPNNHIQVSTHIQTLTKNFTKIMSLIRKKKTIINIQELKKNYNIDHYQIESVEYETIQYLHQQIMQKYSKLDKQSKLKRCWCQNELRLFIWILFNYSDAIKLPIQKFKIIHWDILGNIFWNKSREDCKFEYLSIIKSSNKKQWKNQQDLLLTQIVLKYNLQNKWNQIAKELYKNSNQSYFRKPKQCSQRWKNYLDPNISKNKWTVQQDQCLFRLFLQLGKKWSQISKQIRNRTQHAVKNRYNSLLKKFLKQTCIKKIQINEVQIIKQMLQMITKKKQEDHTILSKLKISELYQEQKLLQTIQQLPISTKTIINNSQKNQNTCQIISPLSNLNILDNTKILFNSLKLVSTPFVTSPNCVNRFDWNIGEKVEQYYF